MILVKVELHPFGDASRAREIARMRIYNDGTGSPWRGNYRADVYRARSKSEFSTHGVPIRHAELQNFPRKSLHVWNLIARLLAKLEYK